MSDLAIMRSKGSVGTPNFRVLPDWKKVRMARLSGYVRDYFDCSRMHPGVERAISHSSSFMSGDTSANNGVLK